MADVTLKTLANEVGVSVRTVGRALRGDAYVREDVREQVQAAAKALGYRPNRLAMSLKAQRSFDVAVLTHSINELDMGKVAGLEERLREAGYGTHLTVRLGPAAGPESAALVEELLARRPAAVVWFGGHRELQATMLEAVRREGLPYVVFGTPGDDARAVDGVSIDRQQGVYEAVRYLAGRGRRRIAYLAHGNAEDVTNRTRLDGYRRAMRELGMAPQLLNTPTAGGQWEAGRAAGLALPGMEAGLALSGGEGGMPDAVQAFSDEVALGFLAGLHERGVRVPLDLALVGFDNRHASGLCWPRLTTVEQPNHEVGVAAAEILLAKLAGEERPEGGWRQLLPTRLVRRDSA